MSRKRIVPKESKTPKYFYVIKVKFRGEELVKLGISSNVARRVCCQYRNENTNGYLLDIYKVFKGNNVKHIETMVKWRMSKKYKAYKQEYFPLEYKDMIIQEAKRAAKYLDYKFIDYDIKQLFNIYENLNKSKLISK